MGGTKKASGLGSQIVSAWSKPATLASNETIKLKNPITVFLMYWTSVPDGEGGVRFFGDVYSRDKAVLDGLRQPFQFDQVR